MATATEVQTQTLKQALVAGGQGSFVQEKLSKSLARHGIRVHTHWSWDKRRPPQKFPEGIDLVYICTDMIGHNLANPCMDYARTSGIPFVNGTRKWAESIERLTGAGFPLIDVAAAIPELIQESRANRTPKQLAEWPTDVDLNDFVSALGLVPPGVYDRTYEANTISTSVATSAATATIPNKAPAMNPLTSIHLALTNSKQREYLRALSVKPDADNVELWQAVAGLPMFAASKFDPERASNGRKSLGINIVRKGGLRVTNVNIPVFTAALKLAKIEGYPAPQATYTEPDGANKTLAPRPKRADTPAPIPVPAPVQTPVPSPVAAKPNPIPVPAQAISPMAELKDIVALLRDKMREMSIVDLHVTPEGVKFKQVMIVEGSLES